MTYSLERMATLLVALLKPLVVILFLHDHTAKADEGERKQLVIGNPLLEDRVCVSKFWTLH